MRTREAVNTMVDKELKQMFEATRGVHNLSFGELLDKAIRELLVSLNQTMIIDQEIARKNIEASRLTQEANDLNNLKEQLKNLKMPVTGNNGNGAEELEAFRNKKFSDNNNTPAKIESTKKMMERNRINWENIIYIYKFKNKDEARAWYEKKIAETEVK